jgi:hypothetical protein
LPVSSVSDFERFAQTLNRAIASDVKERGEKAVSYARQKEREARQEAEQWREESQEEWKEERRLHERIGRREIAEEVGRRWSAFRQAREAALKTALTEKLEAIFPELAECFITWVSDNYSGGRFMMPNAYHRLVTSPLFELKICEEEQVVFEKGNLSIEYSVRRIIEELGDEIALQMHFEDNVWQK